MSSVRTTALSLENRTPEDIEENGIFGISSEEEIEKGGIQAASSEEIEEEIRQQILSRLVAEDIEEGNRRNFGICPEEEIEGNSADDDGGIQAEEENEIHLQFNWLTHPFRV